MLLAQWKSPRDILHCCRIVNGIKNKNMKNSLGATWNASHLADVKYHVPTGFGFSPKARGFYPFGDATDLVRGRRW